MRGDTRAASLFIVRRVFSCLPGLPVVRLAACSCSQLPTPCFSLPASRSPLLTPNFSLFSSHSSLLARHSSFVGGRPCPLDLPSSFPFLRCCPSLRRGPSCEAFRQSSPSASLDSPVSHAFAHLRASVAFAALPSGSCPVMSSASRPDCVSRAHDGLADVLDLYIVRSLAGSSLLRSTGGPRGGSVLQIPARSRGNLRTRGGGRAAARGVHVRAVGRVGARRHA